MKKENKVRVFSKYRPVSNSCPSCGKSMTCLIKLSDLGEDTKNLIYLCGNSKCPQKIDIDKLIKTGKYRIKE